MLKRVCLVSVLALSLSACSSVPSKYAFWADDSAGEPNLADVPAPPDTAEAKAEMSAMRTRLEQDRNNAYLAAQGIIPVEQLDVPAADSPKNPTHMEPMLGGDNEMAPAVVAPVPVPGSETSIPGITQSDASPVQYQYPLTSGTVQYNYTASNDEAYVYGYSPVQIARQGGAGADAVRAIQTTNDNISIDFSALDATAESTDESVMATAPAVSQWSNAVPLVFFQHGSSVLNASDKKAIKQLAVELKKKPISVVVAGHASTRTGLHDALTSRDVNLRMSAKRANAVMKELAKYGVNADQIYIAAYGDTFSNTVKKDGLSQEATDRRVEILFDTK